MREGRGARVQLARHARLWDLFADREYCRLVDAEEEESGATGDETGSGGDAEEV